MALIDTVPTTKATTPTFLRSLPNGQLPADVLRSFDSDGPLFVPVSYAMQALHIAAWGDQVVGFGWRAAHIDTESVGRYRTLARQEAMLKERADVVSKAAYDKAPSARRRSYKGVYYVFRPGTAAVATPGKSNHGTGIADDVAEERTGDNVADSMSDRQLEWMRDNAPAFGFGLETRSERWHWHWIGGDALPQRVVDVLFVCGIEIPADVKTRFGFTVPGPSAEARRIRDGAAPAPAPAPAPAGVPAPTLSLGSVGAEARRLIDVLKFWQWYPTEHRGDTNDGKIGERAVAGIRAMQAAIGASADGVYGTKTAERLAAFLRAMTALAAKPSPWPTATAKPDDRGPVVEQIQRAAVARGWYGAKIDGIYGHQTKVAVQQLQMHLRALGMYSSSVDGIYGPKTAAGASTLAG